jgi:hypothetical protein
MGVGWPQREKGIKGRVTHALYTLSHIKSNKASAYSSQELLNLKSTPNYKAHLTVSDPDLLYQQHRKNSILNAIGRSLQI